MFFTIYFASVLYAHEAEELNMTGHMAHDENRCTFWTSCTVVSWKRPFLWILCKFTYSWLTEMRILLLRVVHTGTEITLKMGYLEWFLFSL